MYGKFLHRTWKDVNDVLVIKALTLDEWFVRTFHDPGIQFEWNRLHFDSLVYEYVYSLAG